MAQVCKIIVPSNQYLSFLHFVEMKLEKEYLDHLG